MAVCIKISLFCSIRNRFKRKFQVFSRKVFLKYQGPHTVWPDSAIFESYWQHIFLLKQPKYTLAFWVYWKTFYHLGSLGGGAIMLFYCLISGHTGSIQNHSRVNVRRAQITSFCAGYCAFFRRPFGRQRATNNGCLEHFLNATRIET